MNWLLTTAVGIAASVVVASPCRIISTDADVIAGPAVISDRLKVETISTIGSVVEGTTSRPPSFIPKSKMGRFLLEASQEVIDAGEAFEDPAAELAALWGARSG